MKQKITSGRKIHMFHVNQIRKENRNAVGTGNLSSTHCKFHNNLNKAYNQSEYRR